MTRTAALLLLTLAAPAGDAAVAQGPLVTIYRQRIVIRVPRMAPARSVRDDWKEHGGPKCLSPRDLAGATVAAPATVDLLLVDGRRLRAHLDKDCLSASFYSGLYLKPGPDGRICADRDAFRVRSGTRCEIRDFRRLSPRRRATLP